MFLSFDPSTWGKHQFIYSERDASDAFLVADGHGFFTQTVDPAKCHTLLALVVNFIWPLTVCHIEREAERERE